MKIFFQVAFNGNDACVLISKDKGSQITLIGKQCEDRMPYCGIQLCLGEDEKLIKWLNKKDECEHIFCEYEDGITAIPFCTKCQKAIM